MNVLENFYFYDETYESNQLNDRATLVYEEIFKTAVQQQQHAREHNIHSNTMSQTPTQ
jgi:hypothetical protein